MSARSRCSWTGDSEIDRLELGDRVADAWANDLILAATLRMSRSIDVPFTFVQPLNWVRAFGVRYLPNTEHRTLGGTT